MRHIIIILIMLGCAVPTQAWESSSDSSSGSGQELSWNEQFDFGDGGSTKVSTQHSTDANGNSVETQKITYTDDRGQTYSETQTSTYDPATGKTTTTQSSEGNPPTAIDDAPPIDKGGVDVSGKSESQSIDSQYRDGGVTDKFTGKDGNLDTEQSVDVNTGKTTSINPATKVARQWQGPPARALPLICRVSSLFTKTTSSDQKARDLTSRMMNAQGKDTQGVIKDWLKENKASFAAGPKSMRVEKVNWTLPLKVAGYSTEHYRVIVEDRPVADLWIAPKVNIWNVMQGGNAARAGHIGRMLLPHWQKVPAAEQKRIFKNLIVLFKTTDGKGYTVSSIKRAADSSYSPPAIPSEYKRETLDTKELLRQANEMMQ